MQGEGVRETEFRASLRACIDRESERGGEGGWEGVLSLSPSLSLSLSLSLTHSLPFARYLSLPHAPLPPSPSLPPSHSARGCADGCLSEEWLRARIRGRNTANGKTYPHPTPHQLPWPAPHNAERRGDGANRHSGLRPGLWRRRRRRCAVVLLRLGLTSSRPSPRLADGRSMLEI